MNTSCKECIFAIWNKNIQIGCELDRLKHFKTQLIKDFNPDSPILYEDKSGNLLEILERELLSDRQFYKLEGICNACRNQEWKDEADSNYLDKLNKEIAIKTDIIFINNSENIEDIEENVKRVLAELHNNKIQPQSVTFSSVVPVKFSDYTNIIEKNCKFKFNVVNPIISQDLPTVHDMCVARGKANYYLTFDLDGETNLKGKLDRLNYALNTKMQQFLMITDGSLHNSVIQRILHKTLNGNKEDSILNKINTLNKAQDKTYVLTWNELLP